MKLMLTLLVITIVGSVNAANIAIIDSGVDYKHDTIAPHMWINTQETEDRRDNDGNGFPDDIYGWNFAENNNQIIDYKYLGTFSDDCSKYFLVQAKVLLGQASDADKAWMKSKREDKDFIKELGKFGNFVHGTHVAGIASRDSNNKIMGIKLIPTEVKPFMKAFLSMKSESPTRWALLTVGLDTLAKKQVEHLTTIGQYVGSMKMDVANGSFGTGFSQAQMISNLAYKAVFLKDPTDEESKKAAALFLQSIVKYGQNFVAAAPNTLFVFAAGNDGLSNDDFGTSPANIKADNVITVAATFQNILIAPFSNYGTKMVEVAAPGMLIKSAVPGKDATLIVSGTSQAAPYVARVAGLVKDANPNLKPVEIKKILMGTVDKKAFLADKVMTGGSINSDRAVVAAQLSKTVAVSEAIARSLVQVSDASTGFRSARPVAPKAVSPVPMAKMFK